MRFFQCKEDIPFPSLSYEGSLLFTPSCVVSACPGSAISFSTMSFKSFRPVLNAKLYRDPSWVCARRAPGFSEYVFV